MYNMLSRFLRCLLYSFGHMLLMLVYGGFPITCIVKVIERQLNEYLEGRLSNLSPELSAQCSSAPVHNMFAERTLALSDFHL